MRREQAERGIFLVAPVDSRLAEEARVGNALPRKREERPDERYDVVVRRVMVLLIDADRGDVGAFGGPPGQRALRDDAIVAREVHARVRIAHAAHGTPRPRNPQRAGDVTDPFPRGEPSKGP